MRLKIAVSVVRFRPWAPSALPARFVLVRVRTRRLIELGGLVVKAGVVDLTGDDCAMIYGALLWMADKLQSDQGEQARSLWAAKGKQAFEADPATHSGQINTNG
jgi:Conjugal transfer protein TraD